MALPKLKSPIFELTLPSTNASVKYRPFLVKEQKILLMALESQEQGEMFRAIKQIIGNCAIDEIDVDELPMFDLEYFFLRLRAKSIGEQVDLRLGHANKTNSKGKTCEHLHDYKLNIMEVEVQKPEDHNPKIQLDVENNIGICLKYPTIALADKMQAAQNQSQIESIVAVICESVDYIYDAENVYPSSESTPEEISAFINDLSQEQFAKVTQFFQTMPKLKHTIKWTCPACGCEDSAELEGMASFFG